VAFRVLHRRREGDSRTRVTEVRHDDVESATDWRGFAIGASGGERGNEGEARDWLNASARFERERARVERRTDEYAFAFRSAM